MTTQPFLDPARTRALYASSDRIRRRTEALHAAKTHGRPVTDVIAELAEDMRPATIVDVGCGRGSTTAHLATRWHLARLVGIDQSPELLTQAHRRLPPAACGEFLCADFHALPLPAASVDLLVAAFCLYHARQPEHVIAELARVLRPGARAVLVTKSQQSYRSLDELVVTAGLDPDAATRPSLYATFHSGNAAEIAATHLAVRQTVHHEHEFHFTDSRHVARYLATTPKYVLPSQEPHRLAEQLQPVLGENGLRTSSTVSYVVAERP